jgi:hypothetical protein
MTTPAPQTQYVYVQPTNRQGGGGSSTPSSSRRPLSFGSGQRTVSYHPTRTTVPKGVPPFLGSRQIIFGCWIAAMAMVTADEWWNNGILPRPARLWETTWVYAGLALVSVVDPVVPLANAFALGYTIVLAYQFFTGAGQFGGMLTVLEGNS